MLTKAICSMFLPSFCNSLIRLCVLLNESWILSTVPLIPPDALLPSCQSAQRTTKVDGASVVGLIDVGLYLRIDLRNSSMSSSEIFGDLRLVKVAR